MDSNSLLKENEQREWRNQSTAVEVFIYTRTVRNIHVKKKKREKSVFDNKYLIFIPILITNKQYY